MDEIKNEVVEEVTGTEVPESENENGIFSGMTKGEIARETTVCGLALVGGATLCKVAYTKAIKPGVKAFKGFVGNLKTKAAEKKAAKAAKSEMVETVDSDEE